MELFEQAVDWMNNLVWSFPEQFPIMVAVLLGFGIFITLRLGFVQLRRFSHGVKSVMGVYDNPDDTGDVNHFQALTTALSATVGIGNIAGVAIAIHFGGPGALFWMWVTAFFGMAIKYTECTLAVKYRIKNQDGSVSGGPMYYIERGLGPNWKWLAVFFAAMAVICSFLTGNAVQANTVADTMYSTFQIPSWASGLFTAAFVGVVIVGGIKRIGQVTARLMPLMAIIYVLGALVILFINAGDVIPAFKTIFVSAFTPEAGLFGVGSGVFLTTLVWGIKRGLFSNEAGQGSAPIAHGAAKTEEPVREGVVALLEPFIDTIVVCTMTGLVIVATGVWQERHEMVYDPTNRDNTVEIVDDSNTLIIEDGLPVNGTVLRNDYETGVFYLNQDESETFTGTLNIMTGTFTDADGNVVATVYTSIIENGASLTSIAFEKGLSPIFPFGEYIVTFCVLLFGISTAISWSYYGDRAIQYLAGDGSIIYYKLVYLGMHFLGAIFPLATVWAIGDIALGLMTFPNIIALFALSGSVAVASKTYFNKMEEVEAGK
ncbi:alanine/glycine:cation symporter family protein [Gracilimonas mengyeensis]|uniref:Alanine or glycine:cation symporter, AGCS family n=1 Tax=Gracilimonas mengyeensis TaxID=1302730 RepID=A0A521FH26_9BACT|nr:sodium:alanine symporter family protein [Gracilimonas mengyeensis]SMO95425.1 alanine or glycine:cation symporter, AGCS family [Gracilimonas mengyeensis]